MRPALVALVEPDSVRPTSTGLVLDAFIGHTTSTHLDYPISPSACILPALPHLGAHIREVSSGTAHPASRRLCLCARLFPPSTAHGAVSGTYLPWATIRCLRNHCPGEMHAISPPRGPRNRCPGEIPARKARIRRSASGLLSSCLHNRRWLRHLPV